MTSLPDSRQLQEQSLTNSAPHQPQQENARTFVAAPTFYCSHTL